MGTFMWVLSLLSFIAVVIGFYWINRDHEKKMDEIYRKHQEAMDLIHANHSRKMDAIYAKYRKETA